MRLAPAGSEPGGPAVEGAPTAVPDMPVPETPAETASPGDTPAWRMNPSGETQPTGTNETPVEGNTAPGGRERQ